MKKNIKIFVAAVATFFAVTTASAQNKIAEGNSFASYKEDLTEAFCGKRYDEVVISVDSTVYWKGRTIEGWTLGGRAGGNFDTGSGESVVGYSVSAVGGYIGKKVDWLVSLGYCQVADGAGKSFGAFNAFLEPQITVSKWGANRLETNRLYIGPMVGAQEARNDSSFDYDDEHISAYGSSLPKSMGLAYGVKIGYEARKFMGAVRWGVQVYAYTYDVKHSFSVNGDVVSNNKDHRWNVGVALTLNGLFTKTAKNY